ncbi:hypothetical protein JQC92_14090 [Shewanella sp. 202IG2-18]|uniref:hypothetical protein n=1 Tax=Parashewanella hymeniacidonis TaxID=2807618 RepID=UPI00196198B3|nr:hypothetical protein [Parashewanella hymeniacidonis]MBM7073142.1 hypothetical protein [Parashewanella hymeniacidonis]
MSGPNGYSLQRLDTTYQQQSLASGLEGLEGEDRFGASSASHYSTSSSKRSQLHSTQPTYNRTALDNPGHSVVVADKCDELRDDWLNEHISQGEFETKWAAAYDDGLVPFSYEDSGFADVAKHTKFNRQRDHVDFSFVLHKKLLTLDPQTTARGYTHSQARPLSEVRHDCVKLLRYMAYAEGCSQLKLWKESIKELNGSGGSGGSIFDSAELPFQTIMSQLLEIDQQQQGRYVAAGGGGLEFEVDSPGYTAEENTSSQSELLDSLSMSVPESSSSFPIFFQVAPKAPALASDVEAYLDNALENHTYKYKPYSEFCKPLALFTPKFNEDNFSFRESVDAVFRAQKTDKNIGHKLVNLHFACKVFERDIPHSREVTKVEDMRAGRKAASDWKQEGVEIPPELMHLVVEAQSGDPKIDSSTLAKHRTAQATHQYIKKLKQELEEKAVRLKVPLVMQPLPSYTRTK